MGCLHDPANVQQTSSKCIQNTRANAGRLLDRVDTPLDTRIAQDSQICACPHDASMTPARGAMRHTRQHRQRLMQQLPPLLISTPLTSSLLARAPGWPRPRSRCCCCSRHAAGHASLVGLTVLSMLAVKRALFAQLLIRFRVVRSHDFSPPPWFFYNISNETLYPCSDDGAFFCWLFPCLLWRRRWICRV